MFLTIILGSSFLIIGYCLFKKLWGDSLRRKARELKKVNDEVYASIRRGQLQAQEKEKYLPLEEDYSEETNEARGFESSAVMDEEDDESEED